MARQETAPVVPTLRFRRIEQDVYGNGERDRIHKCTVNIVYTTYW